ncbi:hypothetical protein B0H14DRAFT_2637597 [Mycena olivaceomarginata]|nr:hypothetical protein B0H14DRAFT_2637597 [Mycena olivaceomarginata]
MDSYFKILRAWEEIVCLNIEIRRLVPWINDEDQFLRNHKLELVESRGSKMAVLVRRLAKTPGFTGTLVPGLDDGWIDVERGGDGEEMQEDNEGEEEEGKELSELIYDMARMTANFVVKSGKRAGLGRTMGVLIGDVGRTQALRLRNAQFFFLVFMATFSVFFVESGQSGGIGCAMSAHIDGVRRTQVLDAHLGGMMTDVSGKAGTPEHAENTHPQTSKCSHLIYCEILRVFFCEVLYGLLHQHIGHGRLTVPPSDRKGIEPSMTPLLEGGIWDY